MSYLKQLLVRPLRTWALLPVCVLNSPPRPSLRGLHFAAEPQPWGAPCRGARPLRVWGGGATLSGTSMWRWSFRKERADAGRAPACFHQPDQTRVIPDQTRVIPDWTRAPAPCMRPGREGTMAGSGEGGSWWRSWPDRAMSLPSPRPWRRDIRRQALTRDSPRQLLSLWSRGKEARLLWADLLKLSPRAGK